MTTIEIDTADLVLVWPREGVQLDVAMLQGLWTETQYLKLSAQTNHLIEFTDGDIEVLPMPTSRHQIILLYMYELLKQFCQPAGVVLIAALRLRIRPDKYREPDILLLRDKRDPRYQDAFWLGADLVVEVVSPDNPERDTVTKVDDYAEAGIPEYWIINLIDESVTVLVLTGNVYTEGGVYRRGDTAHSHLLDGFTADVIALLDAAP